MARRYGLSLSKLWRNDGEESRILCLGTSSYYGYPVLLYFINLPVNVQLCYLLFWIFGNYGLSSLRSSFYNIMSINAARLSNFFFFSFWFSIREFKYLDRSPCIYYTYLYTGTVLGHTCQQQTAENNSR